MRIECVIVDYIPLLNNHTCIINQLSSTLSAILCTDIRSSYIKKWFRTIDGRKKHGLVFLFSITI